jgi:hypothetical protein
VDQKEQDEGRRQLRKKMLHNAAVLDTDAFISGTDLLLKNKPHASQNRGRDDEGGIEHYASEFSLYTRYSIQRSPPQPTMNC